MQTEHYVAIWIVGTIITAIMIGFIARDNERDRSWAIFSVLWPAFAVIAAAVGTFWLLSEFGAWLGRKFPPQPLT